MSNIMEVRFSAKSENESLARVIAASFAAKLDPTLDEIADVDLAMQPLYTSKPELERSGMGFSVMESFMDDVKVSSIKNKGTKVIMLKNINLPK